MEGVGKGECDGHGCHGDGICMWVRSRRSLHTDPSRILVGCTQDDKLKEGARREAHRQECLC